MSHLRTHRGAHEIDAVIETTDGGIVAIEVKSANRHRPGDIKHIEWLAGKVGQTGSGFRGSVLTTGTHISRIRSDRSEQWIMGSIDHCELEDVVPALLPLNSDSQFENTATLTATDPDGFERDGDSQVAHELGLRRAPHAPR